MSIQVISRDYNGTTSIVATVEDLDDAIDRIKSEVCDMNFNNALTTDNKFRSIEAYFPQFVDEDGEVVEGLVYAGNATDGTHRVYDEGSLRNMTDEELRFYIGRNEGEEFFLQTWQNRPVNNFGHDLLEDKTYFFVKVV